MIIEGPIVKVGGMDGHLSFFDFGGMNEKKESFRYVEPVEGHMIQVPHRLLERPEKGPEPCLLTA